MSGTIDQLNFEIILDDKEFDAKVKADIKLANELNTSLSSLLTIKSKIGKFNQDDVVNNRKANQILVDNARAQEKITREKIKTQGVQEKINAQIQSATRGYQTQSRILGEIKNLALGYLSVHGAGQLLSSLVKVTGEFELQKTTLAAMLGDLNKAEQVITKIQGLAVESPFQFKELTTYAKQLSAFSVPAEELFETTKMLADISAGLGVGMDRIVLAYGQVRSAAFLRGQEVRQFTEAGIPILDMLAKQFEELEGQAVSTGEVFDRISARLVPFEMVAKAFKDMTSEGGKFYNMQEIQAETLRGKISNLKDAYEVMLNEIGQGQSENLKGAVDWARKLMQNYEETGKILMELVVAYGVYKTALIGMTVATETFSLANHKLLSTLVSAAKWAATNPFVLIAAGVTAAGYAIYRSSQELEGFQKIQKSVAQTQSDYTKDISKETAKLDALYSKLKLAKKGTEDYNEARKEIFTQYAGYISELRQEGIEVNNLAGIYDSLKTKIEDATKARTSSKAKQKLTETYDQEIDSYYERYINIITKARNQLNRRAKLAGGEYSDFSEFEKAGFWKYVSGSMNKGDLERTLGLERVVNILNDATIDASADLKILRTEMQSTTNEYNKSLKEITKAYGEVSDSTDGIIPPLSGEGENDAAIKAIMKEIKALQTLQKEYAEWKALGVSDEALALNLQGYFPNIKGEHGEDFITQLNYATRILEKVKELEKLAPDEAYDLMMSIGIDKAALDKQAIKDQIKAYEEVAKAANKYLQTLKEWQKEDLTLSGEGITFDVSKIVSDLNGKINEIELRATKARELFAKIDLDSEDKISEVKDIFIKEFGADAWEDFWKAYYTDGLIAIQNLADKQAEYEKRKAQEKVSDLAQKYVKETTSSLDLSEWGDKSIWQVKRIKDAFKEINNSDIKLPEELKKEIESLGLNLDTFSEKVKEAFSSISQEIDEEMLKKIVSLGSVVGEQVLNLSHSLKDFADASGNGSLSNIANAISEIGDTFGSIIDGFKSGGLIGGIVAGVSSLVTKILEAATAQERLARAIEEAAIQQRILNSEYAIMEGANGVFGENAFRKFTNAYEEATKAYKEVQKDLEKSNRVFEGNVSNDTSGWGIAGGLAGGAAVGAAIGSIFPVIGTLIGAGVGAVVGAIAGGVTDVATEADNYVKTLQQMANEIGAPLINDETGAYNLETLEKIKETYSDLRKEDQEWIDNAIANTEIYENALTSMADYMSSVFGNVADDIAESFITAFKESGNAALDYGDIMDGVASQIARDIIKATLLQEVFDEGLAKNAAKELASGNVANTMAIVEQAMDAAQDLAPYMQSFLEQLEPYFNIENQGATDLKEGVKGITEDQANLIVSYMNALRGDVSSMRGLQAKYLPMIGESVPTLLDYMAKIEAETFDISQSNRLIAETSQSLLAEIRSVVTSDGGDAAIRVYS